MYHENYGSNSRGRMRIGPYEHKLHIAGWSKVKGTEWYPLRKSNRLLIGFVESQHPHGYAIVITSLSKPNYTLSALTSPHPSAVQCVV